MTFMAGMCSYFFQIFKKQFLSIHPKKLVLTFCIALSLYICNYQHDFYVCAAHNIRYAP
uniref:Uncharacterized protein n=1 Tax=Arion vulgaris TaxID=1028688 RepID=A0A0B6YXW0_9EUPU